MLHRRWKGGFTRLHRCNATGIDQLLRIAGEIHANVTQALLTAAGVVNLLVWTQTASRKPPALLPLLPPIGPGQQTFSAMYITSKQKLKQLQYQSIRRFSRVLHQEVPLYLQYRGTSVKEEWAVYTSIQTPPAVWLRTQASTKRTPSTPSSTVGKVSVVFSRPALRSESTLQNER